MPRRDSEDFGEQILTKVVKAGRRTYFFDVRATRGDDYFLTITESRKKTNPDGAPRSTGTRFFSTRRTSPNSARGSAKWWTSSNAPSPSFSSSRPRPKVPDG